jgi:hypothetical protein
MRSTRKERGKNDDFSQKFNKLGSSISEFQNFNNIGFWCLSSRTPKSLFLLPDFITFHLSLDRVGQPPRLTGGTG